MRFVRWFPTDYRLSSHCIAVPPYIAGVSARELVRILRRLNFSETEGAAHTVFRHESLGLITTVPRHRVDLSPRTAGAIIQQIGLTLEEFDKARRRRGRIPERFMA